MATLPLVDIFPPGGREAVAPPGRERHGVPKETRSVSMPKLIRHVAGMHESDVARCPHRVFRWCGEILADVVERYAREHGVRAAHGLVLRILHLLRAVVEDVTIRERR